MILFDKNVPDTEKEYISKTLRKYKIDEETLFNGDVSFYAIPCEKDIYVKKTVIL